LASELPDRKVLGVDVQFAAVELARSNRQRLSINNCEFCQSSWFDSLDTGMKFAVIVSNPPYIDENDPHLIQGDVRFEPKTALVSSEHGLADIRHIAGQAHDYLIDEGWLLFEHGFDQGKAVRDILLEFNFCSVETIRDYAGLERVTMGMYRFCGRV
jgi:release factor glutamine methyltransferase